MTDDDTAASDRRPGRGRAAAARGRPGPARPDRSWAAGPARRWSRPRRARPGRRGLGLARGQLVARRRHRRRQLRRPARRGRRGGDDDHAGRRADLRNVAWRALGVQDDIAVAAAAARPRRDPAVHAAGLQRRGTDLLRRSNDVHVVEDTHPAFARILTEITPDEARILRYLYLEGPQPAIDVRTFRPFGIGSVLVAGGLNMIAEHAGLPQPRPHQPVPDEPVAARA